MSLAYKNVRFFDLLGLIQLGWNLFRTLPILAEAQGEVQCRQKQTLECKTNISVSKVFKVRPWPVDQCFILNKQISPLVPAGLHLNAYYLFYGLSMYS